MSNRLVCLCNMVSEQEIINELKKGAVDASDIQYATRAGTSCGKCLMTIDQIIEEHQLVQAQNPQGKLDL
ncbi:(2Fe-2S)-binding protein [Mangrovibacterium marinum]|uniref:Bacterioferritin-associated ferredoxin n=1 Tax=Mangrovibacterium marinum TaxID=1639118 RepID=A0A2T5C0H4_9BACT|nr:(2Fe-2S)-binding protein [Mangrovibacterium marinum]PTN08085.1 BFD-like [2Fe-2S] binding protein [Mangrovibacterium marinum]